MSWADTLRENYICNSNLPAAKHTALAQAHSTETKASREAQSGWECQRSHGLDLFTLAVYLITGINYKLRGSPLPSTAR